MSASTSSSSTAVTTSDSQKPIRNKLHKAGDSLKFLIDPAHGPAPTKLRTRTFLRSVRYLLIFAFWRLVRYAKYAAVGAIVAAVSGTIIGSVASGAAFVIAPTGILGGASMGLVWAVAKFGFRRARARMDSHRAGDQADARADEHADAVDGERPRTLNARVDPW